MKEGRSVQVRKPIRWWAVGCLLIWLAGISAADLARCSCCKPNPAVAVETPCCSKDTAPQSTDPVNSFVAITPQGLDAPPFIESALSYSAPPATINQHLYLQKTNTSIPAELRFGSALWSHAPPTHVS